MAFTLPTFDHSGDGMGKAPKIATYETADNNAAVKAVGYFNDAANLLTTGDLIYVISSDETKIFSTSVAAGVVTLELQLLFGAIT